MSDATDIPWFKCWAAETLSDERFAGWTCEERGAFWTLLCLQWREGSIPSSHDALRRFLHLDAQAFSLVWQTIGGRFAPSDDAPERLANPRMARERIEALSLVQKRAEAGEKGASARWHKGKNRNGKRIATAYGSQCDSAPSQCQAEQKEKESRSEQQHGGLPLREELVGGSNPGCSALRLRLREEGLDLAWPAHDKRHPIEDAVSRCGVEPCVSACLADARGMKKPPASLGIFATTLERLRPPSRPDPTPWWRLLPRERLDAFERERHDIDPELDGGPFPATGVARVEDVRALIARYETEARQ